MQARDRKIQMDTLVLDLSKAFDTVPHQHLLAKLKSYCINGRIHSWVDQFLTNRQQRVIIDGDHSDSVHVDSGVPQGTVMGPLLFLIFVNDLPRCVKSEVRLFADDCLLYREIHSIEDQLTLQADLNALSIWADKWGMRFNAEKCFVLTATPNKNINEYLYVLCGHVLSKVSTTDYLGVTFSQDLQWSTHINKITNKANRTIGFLRRNLKYSPTPLKELAYVSLVRSKLEYSCAAWDPFLIKDINELESVQRRAARFVCRDYKRDSSVTEMMQKLGWQSLEQRRKLARLALMYKITMGKAAVGNLEILQKNSRARAANSCNYNHLRTNTAQHIKSFFPRTIPEWNKIPESVLTDCTSIETFRQRVQKLD